MRIDEIRKRRGFLVQLVLDGEPAALVDKRTMEESPYRVGSSLSEEELSALLAESKTRRTREKALYLLSMRDHSRAELEKKLARESGAEAAADIAGRMEDLGLLNDESYAERLARDLTERRGFSRRHVRQELTAKGIGRDIVDTVMEGLESDDTQGALELLRKKRYNDLSDEHVRQKAMAALGRAGFDWEDIRRAVSLRLEELENENAGNE